MSEKFKIKPASKWEKTANWDHKYRHQNMCVDLDVWYPFLEPLTFKTKFVPLSRQEALAVIHYYQYRFTPYKQYYCKEDTDVLINLEKKVSIYLKDPIFKNGAMFRLSGRSGKDGSVLNNEKIYKEYEDNLEKLKNENISENMKNYTAIARCHPLIVKNEEELMSILLTSERLFLDLKDWLIHGGREQIILREAEPNLTSDKEYRCFIYNNKLCAIGQYDRFGVFNYNILNKEMIEEKIKLYWNEKIKNHMKIKSYVVDVAIIEDKCKLIEFSPFLRCTSASIFRWDNDYKEMISGDGKLRIRDKDYDELSYFIDEWKKLYLIPSTYYKDFYIKDGIVAHIFYYLSYLNPFSYFASNNNQQNIKYVNIFVASLLKNDFYWNKKYINYDGNKNSYLGKGTLKEHTIVLDEDGFGYIIPKNDKQCKGEIFNILYDDFLDVEYFYDNNYDMKEMEIINEQNEKIKCFCYIKEDFSEKDKENLLVKECEEYTKDLENKYFNSMKHNITKEEKYLNMSLNFNEKDSW